MSLEDIIRKMQPGDTLVIARVDNWLHKSQREEFLWITGRFTEIELSQDWDWGNYGLGHRYDPFIYGMTASIKMNVFRRHEGFGMWNEDMFSPQPEIAAQKSKKLPTDSVKLLGPGGPNG